MFCGGGRIFVSRELWQTHGCPNERWWEASVSATNLSSTHASAEQVKMRPRCATSAAIESRCTWEDVVACEWKHAATIGRSDPPIRLQPSILTKSRQTRAHVSPVDHFPLTFALGRSSRQPQPSIRETPPVSCHCGSGSRPTRESKVRAHHYG